MGTLAKNGSFFSDLGRNHLEKYGLKKHVAWNYD